MKINIENKAKLTRAENIKPGECFKYWPDGRSSPDCFYICMRTSGKFCIEDCKKTWPVRFVHLETEEEHGTSNHSLVEILDLEIVNA